VVIARGSEIRQALRESLPKYDPALREQALAEQAAREADSDPEIATTPRPRARSTTTTHADGSIELPEVVVEARRQKRAPLPRMHRPTPPGSATSEPFASPGEQDKQLVKRHFTPLEQAMNRFHVPLFGAPLATYARKAEAKQKYANQLDQLAAMIAYLESQGAPKEEIDKLRALYFDLYLVRPQD
jgi:hypothetical protein